jgi:hypothetical protein
MLLVSFQKIPSPSRRPYEPEALILVCKKGGAVGMLGLIEMLLLLGEKGAKTIKKEQVN